MPFLARQERNSGLFAPFFFLRQLRLWKYIRIDFPASRPSAASPPAMSRTQETQQLTSTSRTVTPPMIATRGSEERVRKTTESRRG